MSASSTYPDEEILQSAGTSARRICHTPHLRYFYDRPLPQVPKGFSSQPESIDATLCRRVTKISRVSVPAVHFQLGGLAAAAALGYVRAYHTAHLPEGTTVAIDKEKCRPKDMSTQWTFVDELDSAMCESDPGGRGESTTESCGRNIQGESSTIHRDGCPSRCGRSSPREGIKCGRRPVER